MNSTKHYSCYQKRNQIHIHFWFQIEIKKIEKHKYSDFIHRNQNLSLVVYTRLIFDHKNTIFFSLIFSSHELYIYIFCWLPLVSFRTKKTAVCESENKWVRIHRISTCRGFKLLYIYVVNFQDIYIFLLNQF